MHDGLLSIIRYMSQLGMSVNRGSTIHEYIDTPMSVIEQQKHVFLRTLFCQDFVFVFITE